MAGTMQAQERDSAVKMLRAKGYYPVSIEKQGNVDGFFVRNRGGLSGVKLTDLANATGQFGMLLKGGMRLSLALDTLSRQGGKGNLPTVWTQVKSDIEQSSNLSAAMAKHPKVFSKVYTAIVGSAEKTGKLGDTFLLLAKQLKVQAAVRAKITAAMVYPVFLLAVSVMVVSVLVVFVVPRFVELFVTANQTLPMPTKILVAITDFVRGGWWMIASVLAGGGFLFTAVMKGERARLMFDRFVLHLPVAGSIFRNILAGRFARTMGSLVNAGVDIICAIDTTGRTLNNRAFAKAARRLEGDIVKGMTISNAVGQVEYFDVMFANMVAVGEETGRLGDMLNEAADIYESRAETAIGSITTLIGPVMIVVLGGIVGFVVLAILLPVFESSSIIK